MNKYQLPQDSQLRQADFLFGVATSSYQIEGGAQLVAVPLRFGIPSATNPAQSTTWTMVMWRVTTSICGNKTSH